MRKAPRTTKSCFWLSRVVSVQTIWASSLSISSSLLKYTSHSTNLRQRLQQQANISGIWSTYWQVSLLTMMLNVRFALSSLNQPNQASTSIKAMFHLIWLNWRKVHVNLLLWTKRVTPRTIVRLNLKELILIRDILSLSMSLVAVKSDSKSLSILLCQMATPQSLTHFTIWIWTKMNILTQLNLSETFFSTMTQINKSLYSDLVLQFLLITKQLTIASLWTVISLTLKLMD